MALVLFAFRRKIAALVILAAAVVACYLFSIEPVSHALLIPLENRYPPFHPADFRANSPAGVVAGKAPSGDDAAPGYGMQAAVVILGGGTVTGSPDGESFGISPGAFKRLVYGEMLAEKLRLPIILSGGIVNVPAGTPPEADIEKQYLLRRGFSPDAIFVEAESTTTWENAVNVVAELRPKEVILVTSAYHMPRAVFSFVAQGAKVVPAPTDYRADRPVYGGTALLPSALQMGNAVLALHEYFGLATYRLRYANY